MNASFESSGDRNLPEDVDLRQFLRVDQSDGHVFRQSVVGPEAPSGGKTEPAGSESVGLTFISRGREKLAAMRLGPVAEAACARLVTVAMSPVGSELKGGPELLLLRRVSYGVQLSPAGVT